MVGGGERCLPLTFNSGFFVQEMLKEDMVCEPAAMDSEDVLFLLYTSGSTGKPKGLVHTQAGYLLYAALTHRVKVMPKVSCHISYVPCFLTACPLVPSMSSATRMGTCLAVWQTSAGSLDTVTPSTGPWLTGEPLCCLKALLFTPIQVGTAFFRV